MILRNPTGRPVRLEILSGADGDPAMVLSIGKHCTVDLDKYQRALDTLAQAAREEVPSSDHPELGPA